MDEKSFSTRDIGLAAALVTNGKPVTKIAFQYEGARRNNAVGYFYFDQTAELKKLERDFWSGSCRIEPKSFLLNLRSLKSQVTNLEKNPDYKS